MTARNNSTNEQINGSSSTDASLAAPPAHDEAPQPKKRAKTVKSSSAKTVASKKKSAKTTGKKATPNVRTRRAGSSEPSDADIRLRAYFIAEHRVQQALQGDPAHDWLEARQQLVAEAAQNRV